MFWYVKMLLILWLKYMYMYLIEWKLFSYCFWYDSFIDLGFNIYINIKKS